MTLVAYCVKLTKKFARKMADANDVDLAKELKDFLDATDPQEAINNQQILKPVYFCYLCKKLCDNSTNLSRHVEKCEKFKESTKNQPIGCLYCPRRFGAQYLLESHMKTCIKVVRVSIKC